MVGYHVTLPNFFYRRGKVEDGSLLLRTPPAGTPCTLLCLHLLADRDVGNGENVAHDDIKAFELLLRRNVN